MNDDDAPDLDTALRRAFATAALLIGTAAAAAPAVPVAPATEYSLGAGGSTPLPGGATLTLLGLDDERCRPVEHCSEAESRRRGASAEPVLTTANGRRYQPGALVLGETGPVHAKLGHWLVELVEVTPPGRTLPADGPGRVQQARLRVTPADRVAIGTGAAMALPQAGFTLRVVSIDDRRCPQGVYCASAGHVQVVADVSVGSASPTRLVFGAPGGTQAHRWQGHDLQLCDVQPRVRADGSTATPPLADFFVNPARGGPLTDADLHGLSCPRSGR